MDELLMYNEMPLINKTKNKKRENWWEKLFDKYESLNKTEDDAIDCNDIVKDYGRLPAEAKSTKVEVNVRKRTSKLSTNKRRLAVQHPVKTKRKLVKPKRALSRPNLRENTTLNNNGGNLRSPKLENELVSNPFSNMRQLHPQTPRGEPLNQSLIKQSPSSGGTNGPGLKIEEEVTCIKSEPASKTPRKSIRVQNAIKKKNVNHSNPDVRQIMKDWDVTDISVVLERSTDEFETSQTRRLTRSMIIKTEPDRERKPSLNELSKSLYVPRILHAKEVRQFYPRAYKKMCLKPSKKKDSSVKETSNLPKTKTNNEMKATNSFSPQGPNRSDLLFTKYKIEDELKSDLTNKLFERFKAQLSMKLDKTQDEKFMKDYQTLDNAIKEELVRLKDKVSLEHLKAYMMFLIQNWRLQCAENN